MNTTLIEQLEDIRRRTRELVAGLSPEQLTRRPDPTKWSIAECLAHLNVTAAGYLKPMDAAIQQGRENKMFGKGPYKPGFLGSVLRWFAEPPPKIRLRAPKAILPPTSISDGTQVVAEFMRVQDEWERLAKAMDGLDLKKVKCNGIRPMPRLRLAAPIPWMLAHERRHLLQAENVKKQLQAQSANA